MYCNFYINNIETLVKSLDKIKDAKVVEDDNNIIVAIKTAPVFNKSDINLLLSIVTQTVKSATDKNVYVTRDMEIFCDIINYNENLISFQEILDKVRWLYENVWYYQQKEK